MVSEKQKQFVKTFEGQCMGRYHILYLTLIGLIGGEELKKEVQAQFGRPDYSPTKLYPQKEASLMVMHAVERGVSAERLGGRVPQLFQRKHPELMEIKNKEEIVDKLLALWESETSYGQKPIEIIGRGPNRALLARKINPMPCEFFKGAILGIFELFKVPCKCREIKCHWQDEKENACVYEVTWE